MANKKLKYKIGDKVDYNSGSVQTKDIIHNIVGDMYHYYMPKTGIYGSMFIEKYEKFSELNKESLWNNQLQELLEE